MDQHNEEEGCYDNRISGFICKKCNHNISFADLKNSEQSDGSYICPGCQHDEDAEKLRIKMERV